MEEREIEGERVGERYGERERAKREILSHFFSLYAYKKEKEREKERGEGRARGRMREIEIIPFHSIPLLDDWPTHKDRDKKENHSHSNVFHPHNEDINFPYTRELDCHYVTPIALSMDPHALPLFTLQFAKVRDDGHNIPRT